MKLLFALIVLLSLATVSLAQRKPCRPAKHAKLPRIVGLRYQRARRILLAAGWQPLKTKSSDADVDVSSGNGPIFWRSGYVELESCSGIGVAACAFLFKDAFGNRLRVTTAGEELPGERIHAAVNRFRFVCD